MSTAMINIQNLSKVYPMGEERVVALHNVSMQVHKGEICCIFGPSGSGKSTLLNMMAGMEKPSRGLVEIAGQNVGAMSEKELTRFRQKHTGFIFQSYNLLSFSSALDNVAMPLLFQGIPKAQRQKMARLMLQKVGLQARMDHFPSQMSGGQQQRVGIARALITRPDVVFADEPTGNLDSKTRIEVMELLRKFSRSLGQTIILVTHDAEMASYADHTITLKDGAIVHEEYRTTNPQKERSLNS